jgi:hypothetical protein
MDEYERYCISWASSNVSNPLEWWMEEQQQLEYPILSRLALPLLAIPAQSSESERIFSTMNQLVTEDRHSMRPENIAKEVLLFKWRRLIPNGLDYNIIDCEGAKILPVDGDIELIDV